jgi:hypothetical protein
MPIIGLKMNWITTIKIISSSGLPLTTNCDWYG